MRLGRQVKGRILCVACVEANGFRNPLMIIPKPPDRLQRSKISVEVKCKHVWSAKQSQPSHRGVFIKRVFVDPGDQRELLDREGISARDFSDQDIFHKLDRKLNGRCVLFEAQPGVNGSRWARAKRKGRLREEISACSPLEPFLDCPRMTTRIGRPISR